MNTANEIYVVTHPEAGVVGVFTSVEAWEQYLQANGFDDAEYTGEFHTLNGEAK